MMLVEVWTEEAIKVFMKSLMVYHGKLNIFNIIRAKSKSIQGQIRRIGYEFRHTVDPR